MITLDQLKAVSGRNNIICNNYLFPLNQTLATYAIDTDLRMSHFFAQILLESWRFKYTLEESSGQEYEGRIDLGNVQAGDGVLFKGRGLIQITGRANYQALTNDLGRANNVDFIAHPELLQQPLYATLSAGWFWNKHRLNRFADTDDIKNVTLRINGGYNNLDMRIGYLNKAKKIFITPVITSAPPMGNMPPEAPQQPFTSGDMKI